MKTSEYIFVGILAAFAASISIGSSALKYSDQYSFGPGFIPLNVGILLVACCAIQALRSYRKAEGKDEDSDPNYKGLALGVLIIGGGIAAMSFGSILIPIFFVLLLLSWRVASHPLPISLLVSATTTAIIYLIFSIWLGLPVS
jgi:4-amino-4-deoxy-L-arabinose transferase-like glycosyltransferase